MTFPADESEIQRLREVMNQILPDAEIRQLVLKTFSDSIELANAGNPKSWTLGLVSNGGLKLQIANLKVAEIAEDSWLYLLVDTSEQTPEVRDIITQSLHPNASAPRDISNAERIFVSPQQVQDLLPSIQPAYDKLILRLRDGESRRAHDNSPAALLYLMEETGRNLPDSPHSNRTTPKANQVRVTMEKAYPEPSIRLKIMTIVANSIELAHEGNPKSWCLSFPGASHLRLNVGQMETIVPGEYQSSNGPSLLLVIDTNGVASVDLAFVRSFFIKNPNNKSFPSAERIRVPVTNLDEILPRIQSAHDQLIVGLRSRNTIWSKSHSPEALQYVRDETGRSLPNPAYADQSDSPVASRAWKVSPGSQGSHLKRFIQEGIIAVGWSDTPMDLSILAPDSSTDIAAEFERQEKLTTTAPNGGPNQLWWFYGEISVGDRVFLYANNAIRASGIVTGDYYYQEDDLKYAHRRAVEWEWEGAVYRRALSTDLDKLLTLFQTIIPLDTAQSSEIQSHIDRKSAIRPASIKIDWRVAYRQLFADEGLHYTQWQQAVFFTALQTKGFVILSGISGTGKTKIAQAFSAALPQPDDGRNVEFLTVRPDWRDSKSLLGYHNPITDRYEWTPFLRFLLRASESWEARDGLAWFVILDEMNLAHVEHYFAELLSVLESGRDEEGWTREAIQLSSSGAEGSPPASLKLPPNLHIIGTVNLDETTHAFSPKVLDRAFAMELSDVSFVGFPFAAAAGDSLSDDERDALLDAFSMEGAFPRIDQTAISERLIEDGRPRDWLESLNRQLRPHHMHFGYRVFAEIMAFVDLGMSNELFAGFNAGADTLVTTFDAAVLMKVLPKFHGSRAKLEGPLTKVLGWCLKPDYPDTLTIANAINQAASPDALEAKLLELSYTFPETAHRAIRLLWTAQVDGFAAFG